VFVPLDFPYTQTLRGTRTEALRGVVSCELSHHKGSSSHTNYFHSQPGVQSWPASCANAYLSCVTDIHMVFITMKKRLNWLCFMRPRLWPVCQKHSYVLRLWEILFLNVLDQHVFPSLSHCCTVKVLIKTKPHLAFLVLSFFLFGMIERFNESMFSITQYCGTHYSNCVSKWCWIFIKYMLEKIQKSWLLNYFTDIWRHFSIIVLNCT